MPPRESSHARHPCESCFGPDPVQSIVAVLQGQPAFQASRPLTLNGSFHERPAGYAVRTAFLAAGPTDRRGRGNLLQHGPTWPAAPISGDECFTCLATLGNRPGGRAFFWIACLARNRLGGV